MAYRIGKVNMIEIYISIVLLFLMIFIPVEIIIRRKDNEQKSKR